MKINNFPKYDINAEGEIQSNKSNRLLKHRIDTKINKPYVILTHQDKTRHKFYIENLVEEHFPIVKPVKEEVKKVVEKKPKIVIKCIHDLEEIIPTTTQLYKKKNWSKRDMQK